MTAARLREAARVLRERAEAATAGPWAHCMTGSGRHWVEGPGEYNGYDDSVATGIDASDAAYIATMGPIVGLALADLLDDGAGYAEWLAGNRLSDPDKAALFLAVADAILGEAL